jgi:alkanesulfonate monooxygenase SsuD/methylene tetrahydromethanopterin reductase-like flavin-dependent oxidoreductase (luciferase family)
MHFGVFDHLDRDNLDPSEYYEARLKLIEIYDRAGFYAYHFAEHHGTPIGMIPSPSVFMAAIAQRTQRLRFGAMVYPLPLYHPLRLIEEICVLDQMSGGRLDIGFGRGSSPTELSFFGGDPNAAQDMYAESLEVILKGFTHETLTFHGNYYRLENVPMAHRPFQKPFPPLWYGVHSAESAERAARKGQQVLSLDSSTKTQHFFGRYRAVWSEAGHISPAEPKMGISRFVVVADRDAEAQKIARRAYRRWHESFDHLANRYGRVKVHPRPADFDSLVESGQGVAGSVATVTAALRAQIEEAGANYFVGQFAFGDLTSAETTDSLNRFVREVVPGLLVPKAPPVSAAVAAH